MSEPLDFSTHPRRSRPAVWELGLAILGMVALGLAAQAAWGAQASLAAARARVDVLRREAEIDRARVQAWIAKGAQPSNTVKRLMQNVREASS